MSLYTCLSRTSVSQFVSRCVSLCLSPPMRLSFYRCVSLDARLSLCASMSVFLCLSIYLFLSCLLSLSRTAHVYHNVSPNMCLSLSTRLYLCASISVCICLYACLSLCVSVSVRVHLYACPSLYATLSLHVSQIGSPTTLSLNSLPLFWFLSQFMSSTTCFLNVCLSPLTCLYVCLHTRVSIRVSSLCATLFSLFHTHRSSLPSLSLCIVLSIYVSLCVSPYTRLYARLISMRDSLSFTHKDRVSHPLSLSVSPTLHVTLSFPISLQMSVSHSIIVFLYACLALRATISFCVSQIG